MVVLGFDVVWFLIWDPGELLWAFFVDALWN
jgi:hypothetical protein